MKITVFGSGYVGLVSGACLAEVGNKVMCVDVDPAKIDLLNSGGMPIYEPGLAEMVRRNSEAGRLRFTTDAKTGVDFGQIQFIAVGTPPDEDGSADLQYVLAVAESIAEHMQGYKVVVDKSTVPVGTGDRVAARMRETLSKRGVDFAFDVVSNPEFLKEGAAIADFMKPDRIVVGTESPRAIDAMRQLYAPFNRNHERLLLMDTRSAELTKYAANAMLATKISFMNELSNLAEILGADIEKVRVGIGSDPRIGFQFIYPGCGYGGSCFPKDVQALEKTAMGVGYAPQLLNAVEAVNNRQKQTLFRKISEFFGGDLNGRTVALWGLAFKPNTDDMRAAPSRTLMESLWEAGARVRAFDPVAHEEARRIYGARDDFTICATADEAIEDADILAVVTEWIEFRSPDFDEIRDKLRHRAIFDGRNLYDPRVVSAAGLTHFSIGRRAHTPD
ncbi:MAG: UDP-glucose/GDP-mannose dehydrogenase family protein [Gammaproteobacteria bacterium]|nr:UDP-glucose/GDP-mannose dehydrogenase family protein [Gammaproteobacteria bacterium]